MVFFLSFGINRMSVGDRPDDVLGLCRRLWASASPRSCGSIPARSVAETFFITAATFGAMSLWGYTTKADLSGMGSFLFMGLIGILIAMVVNFFLHSAMINWIISVAGVLIFTGLTAYDTQWIKEMYVANDDGTVAGRKAIIGALKLYLDFLNLFLFLLRFLGVQRR